MRDKYSFLNPLKLEYINKLTDLILHKYLEPIYFLTIRKIEGIDISKFKGLILGVIEYGEQWKKHYHLLSTTNEYFLKGCSAKLITSRKGLYNRLKYMQKEKKILSWDFITIPILEESCREESLICYEHLLESKKKELYSLEEIHREMNKDNTTTTHSSIIVKTRGIILKYISKLSYKLEWDFDIILNKNLWKKSSRNTTSETDSIRSFLKSDKVQLNLRSLLWYLLYLVILLGGLSGIVMQELYKKIGIYMLNTFEQEEYDITEKYCYRLGSYLCDALEKVLKEGTVLLWSKKDDLTISILETVNKYVSEEIQLKKKFLEYLKIENLFESSIAMIMKPSKEGYLDLRNIKTVTSQGSNINIKISNLGYHVIKTLQETRYKINKDMYRYLKSNINYFISLYSDKEKELKVIIKPDFNNYQKIAVNQLEESLKTETNEINVSFLIEHLLEKVVFSISKIKSTLNNHALASHITLNIKKVLIYTNYTKANIDRTKLYYTCKKLIMSYKILLHDYSNYMSYLNKLKGIKAKITDFKETIYILDVWSKDYLYYDQESSLYFVWRIDHRGRLYPIGNKTMMGSKLIRYCLEPLYKYSFKRYKRYRWESHI